MWIIALLLVVSFVLFVLGKIAKTWGMRTVFVFLALAAAWSTAWWSFSLGSDYARGALFGSIVLFSAISDLIGILVWRRRALPPCVRAKRYQSAAAKVITSVCFIALAISLFFSCRDSLDMLLAGVAFAVAPFYHLFLFDTIEICANGVREGSRLRPWDDFESFAWERKKGDKVELRLQRKSEGWQWLRLVVPPEDREAAQKILVAHLPDTSAEKVEA
jgi:hypothetical protein